MSAAERITVEDVVENAEDYADERSTTVEWIIENAEDVADEENARATRPEIPMEDRRPMLVLERADLELVVTHPWAGIAALGCHWCGGTGWALRPWSQGGSGCHSCGGFGPAAGTGQTDLPDGTATMLLADTTGRIHGTWAGRLLPMVDVTPDPPSAPHVYIRPGDNAVYIWNHPHPLAYMPTESLTGTWAPGGYAVNTVKFERCIDDLGIPSGYPTSYPDPGQQVAPCITTINLGGNP